MSNAFQLLSSYFRLFAWQHVLCCITEFLQQKNVHSVLQSFLLFFRMCHSCKPVSHPVIHIIGIAILFVFTCLKRLRCQYKTKKSLQNSLNTLVLVCLKKWWKECFFNAHVFSGLAPSAVIAVGHNVFVQAQAYIKWIHDGCCSSYLPEKNLSESILHNLNLSII